MFYCKGGAVSAVCVYRKLLNVTFISDVERGKPTAEIEKTIRLINILGLDLLVEKRG